MYAQIQWAIGALGLAKQFRCTVSPMECTYLPTGQKILFFGTDDPGKLKSIKVPFGAIGLAWFEELDQFDGPEEVRSVEQSVFRGGSFTLEMCIRDRQQNAHPAGRAGQKAGLAQLAAHNAGGQCPDAGPRQLQGGIQPVSYTHLGGAVLFDQPPGCRPPCHPQRR